jgi:hypothetical protein
MAKTIFVEVVANASQFKKELTGAVAATNKANSGFQRMGKAAGVAGLLLAGGLAYGLEKAAKGAMEDQVEMERLTQAFHNAHLAIGPFAKRIEEAQEAGRKLGFQDEEVTRSLGTLVTATKDGTKAIQLNATAMNIARFKHVELAEASKMLTSTMAGNVRSAKALGIILLPVTSNVDALRARYKELGDEIPKAELRSAKFADKQATAAQAIAKVNAAVKDQAETFAGTAQGKLEIYNARMDQLKDSIGKGVLPAVTALAEKMTVFAGFLAKHATLTQGLVIGLGLLSVALIALSVASGIAAIGMSAFWIAATGGLILAIPAIVAGIAFLVTHMQEVKATMLRLVYDLAEPFSHLPGRLGRWARDTKVAVEDELKKMALKEIATKKTEEMVAAIRKSSGPAAAGAAAVAEAVHNAFNKMDLATVAHTKTTEMVAAIRRASGPAAAGAAAIGAAIKSGVLGGAAGLGASLAAQLVGEIGVALSAARHAIGAGSPSRMFAEKLGHPIAEGIALGIREGEPLLTAQLRRTLMGASTATTTLTKGLFRDPLRAAKQEADTWAESDGASNMAEVGTMLGQTFIRNLQAAASGVSIAQGMALGGSRVLTDDTAPGGAHGSVVPGRGGAVVNVTVNGSVTSESDLADTIYQEFLRRQSRNVGLGFA